MELTEKDKTQLKILGGIAAVGLATYFIFFNKDNGGAANDPTGNGYVDPEVVNSFNATKAATELYDAMRGWGTDEEMVTAVLGKMTEAQFGQVYAKFGKKYYNTVTGDQTEYLWQPIEALDLAKWLFHELDAKTYQIYKRKFPKYL